MGARNGLLKIMVFTAIVLHKTDFAIFTVLPVSLAELCALLINVFEKLHKTSPIKLRGNSTTPATSKQELFMTLVTIKSFKRNNSMIKSKATKIY